MRRDGLELAICCGILVALASACGGQGSASPPPPPPPAGPLSWPLWDSVRAVKAIAVADDGTVYVGGNFTRMGPMTGSGVPVHATTGQAAAAFPKVEGAVLAVVPDGSGGWYVGGQFSRVGGQARENLAHVLADGSLDPAWAPGARNAASADAAFVRALAVEGGVLYVAGYFDTVGGAIRLGLGALDARGDVTGWAPAVTPYWGVNALAPAGGTVYLGGSFTEVNGQARSQLAAVDGAGSLTGWNPGAEGLTASGWVTALAVSGETVFVGGWFDRISGQPRYRLAAVDAAGAATPWSPLLDTVAGSTGTSGVEALALDGGNLYVGGYFGRVDGQPRSGLAAFDGAGRLAPWAPELDVPFVSALAARSGTVYAAGSFTRAGGLPRSRLAAFDGSGAPTPWDPDVDDEGWVSSLAVSRDAVYAGGQFRWVGKETRRAGLAAIDPGGRVTSWNPGVSGSDPDVAGWSLAAGGSVSALAVVGDTLYVAGDFARVGGEARRNLAAVDASGAVTPWNPAADGPVHALAAGHGLVYAGGRFREVGGQPRANLAALDASGRVTAWNPGANALVTTLAVDGWTVYAGGYFTAVGGLARSTLAAVDVFGVPLPWSPAVSGSYGFAGPDGVPGVWSLAPSGSAVYFTGDFKAVGGLPRDRVAAVDGAGEPTAFALPDPHADFRALQLGLGRVLLGGTFEPSRGSGDARIAGLAMVAPESTASSWSYSATVVSEYPQRHGSTTPRVEAIAVHDGTAYVGGVFWGSPRWYRRWGLAAVDGNGNVTSWDPNPFP